MLINGAEGLVADPLVFLSRLPDNTNKLTFYEPSKLLTEQGVHLSLVKSYQVKFHLYSWLVLQF